MPRPGLQLFPWGERTYVMAIVNATPDSFSGDGVGGDTRAALRRAEQAIEDGADILDVGGESTRPGAEVVPEEAELGRVIPIVARLSRLTTIPISVDTYKAAVAERALAAGACIVNDVWGLRRDPRMGAVVAGAGAHLVLMHNRLGEAEVGPLGGYFPRASYVDVLEDVAAELARGVETARAAGIRGERILVDPGLGFGKTPAQSRELVRRLPELRARLPLPVLVGPSRKSFVGLVTGVPPEDRLAETLAAIALCVAGGADVVRVHDVAPAVRACRVADAIVRPVGARE
jgi:dihydropteroate synthase